MSKLLKLYLKEFKKNNSSGSSILDKNYNTTIIRNLMISLLHKEYKKGFIKKHEILKNFNIKYEKNIYQKINKTREYIDNPHALSKKESKLFKHYYYKLIKITKNYERDCNTNTSGPS